MSHSKSNVSFFYSTLPESPSFHQLDCGACILSLLNPSNNLTQFIQPPLNALDLTPAERTDFRVLVEVKVAYTPTTSILITTNSSSPNQIPLYHAPRCPLNPQLSSDYQLFPQDQYLSKNQRIRLAVAVLVVRPTENLNHKEVLITQRSSKLRLFPSVWVIPGGHVDDGETVEQAALREVYEETGLKISGVNLLCLYESVYPQERMSTPIMAQHIIFYFVATVERSAQLKLQPDEVECASWLHQDQVKTLLCSKSTGVPQETFVSKTPSGQEVHRELKQLLNKNMNGEHLSIGTQFVFHEWFAQQNP